MRRPHVVIFTTYPFAEPRHGGQLRAAAIARAYQAAGFVVSSLTVYEPETYPATKPTKKPAARNDVPFSLRSPFRSFDGQVVPFIADLQSGRFAAGDERVYKHIRALLPAHIDLMHLEQPWL